MAKIQLLITDDANRDALASLVSSRHEVCTASSVQPADCHLVDDASLPEYHSALESYKREHAPVFCPVVLIWRERTPVSVDLPEPDPTDGPLLVNEEVTAPVGSQTLFRRIANLLVRRRQTTELQEKNERLEQFARTLRHEIRNPLQALDGYLDIARERGSADAFEECQRAIDQMDRLFEDTLVVLDGTRPEIEEEAIDLPVTCRHAWEAVSEVGARLEVPEGTRIVADRERLVQLLHNLFRNSIEHGHEDVTVTVGALEDGFYVEDDGPGIAADEREAVFEEGYSLNGAGTGLGLAVVNRVVDVHGWDVELTAGTTGGARFEFTGVTIV